MASSPFERLLTAGLKASNESRRQVEAALIRLVDAHPTPQHVENSDQVSELVEREVAREVGLRTDELVDRLDELETRLAEAEPPEDAHRKDEHRKDDKGKKKKQHGKKKHGKKEHGKKKDRKKKQDSTKHAKSTSTRKAKRSATTKRTAATERTAPTARPATTKRVGATEPAARDGESVGSSGVRRVPTTRSARNEG